MHVCEKERWHAVSLQKFINEIHLRTAIDRFLRFLPLKKPFSVISDLRKTGKVAGVLEPRNGKKQTSNELRKKLFDSSELGRSESKNPAPLQRTT